MIEIDAKLTPLLGKELSSETANIINEARLDIRPRGVC